MEGETQQVERAREFIAAPCWRECIQEARCLTRPAAGQGGLLSERSVEGGETRLNDKERRKNN